MDKYDSRADTLKHIKRVKELLRLIEKELEYRAITHDISKLSEPEKSIFDRFTPLLRDSTYGSEEYKGFLAGMKEALDHHYQENRHHPEFHEYGILDMNLVDLVEMICDQIAASERHAKGDVNESIKINQERFGYGDVLKQIFINTVDMIKNTTNKENV